jgi:hypothetical protein
LIQGYRLAGEAGGVLPNLLVLMDWLSSPNILRVSVMTAPVFLLKLSINSRSEITVGSNSPPYLSLARLPRKFVVLSSAPSTAAMPSSAVAMMLVIFAPLPDSDAVKLSKFRSVSFTAASLSAMTLSTLRSAARIFSWVLSVPSGSAVSSECHPRPCAAAAPRRNRR